MTFEDLGLSEETLRAVHESGYSEPTPIQAKAIPPVLMMRDVIGLAQTGTGKTASFTLPMIDILSGGRARMRMPRSLVLAPTRELAAQVAENFDKYGKYHKLTKALLVGGESMGEQMKLLEKGVDVLIATPGRLLDLFERGAILLNDIKILVIDEADRMLDMGFIPDIDKICSFLPHTRQTLLFSATMAPEIKRLTEKYLSNPKEVSVAPPASPATTVQQSLIHTSPRGKEKVLLSLLSRENVKNAFVFLNRKKDIPGVAQFLTRSGYAAAPMHGDMPQTKRNEVLQDFKDGKVILLICSDVAARGLDVKGVSHVFNYDVPMSADDYVHRIGRTGRAGMSGRAYMLATDHDEKFLDAIEKLIGRKIDTEEVAGNVSSASSKEEKGDAPEKKARPERAERSSNRPERTPRADRPERAERAARPERAERPDRAAQKKPHKAVEQDDKSSSAVGFGEEDEIPAFLR